MEELSCFAQKPTEAEQEVLEQLNLSSLNDSDSSDDERVASLSTQQISNILKSYFAKLQKWVFAQKLVNDRWLVSKKINYYQMKTHNWKIRLLDKKIEIRQNFEFMKKIVCLRDEEKVKIAEKQMIEAMPSVIISHADQ